MNFEFDFTGYHSEKIEGLFLGGGINNDSSPQKKIKAEDFDKAMIKIEEEIFKRMDEMKDNYKKGFTPSHFMFNVRFVK